MATSFSGGGSRNTWREPPTWASNWSTLSLYPPGSAPAYLPIEKKVETVMVNNSTNIYKTITSLVNSLTTKKTTRYDIANTRPALRQVQKCGRIIIVASRILQKYRSVSSSIFYNLANRKIWALLWKLLNQISYRTELRQQFSNELTHGWWRNKSNQLLVTDHNDGFKSLCNIEKKSLILIWTSKYYIWIFAGLHSTWW